MNVEVTAQVRNVMGKGAMRRLRRDDNVPAILYGPKTQPVPLTVSALRMEKLLREMGEESRLIQLTVEGGAESQARQVIIRQVQLHPFKRRFLHIDFYEVPMDHSIVVNVPVELTGECIGVKKGGTLNLIRRTLSVRCLPGAIPERIQVSVATLDLGESIQVNDLLGQVPVDLLDDRHCAVVNIVAPEAKATEETPEAQPKGKGKGK